MRRVLFVAARRDARGGVCPRAAAEACAGGRPNSNACKLLARRRRPAGGEDRGGPAHLLPGGQLVMSTGWFWMPRPGPVRTTWWAAAAGRRTAGDTAASTAWRRAPRDVFGVVGRCLAQPPSRHATDSTSRCTSGGSSDPGPRTAIARVVEKAGVTWTRKCAARPLGSCRTAVTPKRAVAELLRQGFTAEQIGVVTPTRPPRRPPPSTPAPKRARERLSVGRGGHAGRPAWGCPDRGTPPRRRTRPGWRSAGWPARRGCDRGGRRLCRRCPRRPRGAPGGGRTLPARVPFRPHPGHRPRR